MKGEIPPSACLPTGLGKTSVIAIWLIALANGAMVPRRLVYVVNRRTVVDQTTEEVEKYKRNNVEGIPDFAVSTLRGQYADNGDWSADPSRPAVICGTVDMIGSRLLFSGYGIGKGKRPLHAGFLGQDALLVHDEAHLEPAFQELLLAIENEQKREPDVAWPKFRVMELTATSKTEAPFVLTDRDYRDESVDRRMNAVKTLHLKDLADPKKPQADLIKKALEFKDSGKAILIFAYGVETVLDVAAALEKAKLPVKTLTGTMRGHERDRLVVDKIFARFLPNPPADATRDTVFLVCTSAGEVGVNISADHLICDLSTYESMAQRLGRVNRFGRFDSCEVHVFYPDTWDEKHPLTEPRQKTLELLKPLDGKSVSPKTLNDIPVEVRNAAFAPPPIILPATDILFDAWALTTIKGKLPGRPPVEPYLHGLPTDWQPAETQVAWREEVKKLQPNYDSDNEREERQYQDHKVLAKLAEELLDEYPLKPHELLQDRMTRVREAIDTLAKSFPDEPAWVVGEGGDVIVTTLHDLTLTEKRDGKTVHKIDSRFSTILLPPSVGGLNDQGMLDAKAAPPDKDEQSLDVADAIYLDKARTVPLRLRTDTDEPPEGMRLLRRVPLPAPDDEEAETDYWYWYVRSNAGDDDASKSSREPVTWKNHTDGVTNALAGIVSRLFPSDGPLQNALSAAARWHDLGKRRIVWQRSIGNPNPTEWYAKSGKDPRTGRLWKPSDLTDYRHEFGSLVDLQDPKQEFHTELSQLDPEHQELVLHLIAAHHGRARPHFPADEAFDPDGHADLADRIARETPRRFAQLQRKYGRWGLAYLESLLRAADWAASADPSKFVEGQR